MRARDLSVSPPGEVRGGGEVCLVAQLELLLRGVGRSLGRLVCWLDTLGGRPRRGSGW